MGIQAHILTLFRKDSKLILYNLNLTPPGTRNLGNIFEKYKDDFLKKNLIRKDVSSWHQKIETNKLLTVKEKNDKNEKNH